MWLLGIGPMHGRQNPLWGLMPQNPSRAFHSPFFALKSFYREAQISAWACSPMVSFLLNLSRENPLSLQMSGDRSYASSCLMHWNPRRTSLLTSPLRVGWAVRDGYSQTLMRIIRRPAEAFPLPSSFFFLTEFAGPWAQSSAWPPVVCPAFRVTMVFLGDGVLPTT